MASGQDYRRLLQMMLGQGGPNPYMGLDLRNRLGDYISRMQARYFPNQYNNMLNYIPDDTDVYANKWAMDRYSY